jgi:hypothetical protein
MNRRVNPEAMTPASFLFGDMRTAVLSYIADPAATERAVAERLRNRYSGDHPELASAKKKVEEDESRLARLREVSDRHAQAMRGGDLMRERLFGPREGALTRFDLGIFVSIACIGTGGNFVALTNVATYVADSGVIASLTDNFFRALFVSAIPFSGAAVVKAFGAFQPDDKSERTFNLRIAAYAIAFAVLHITALSIAFAPHKLDAAAMQEALTNGVSPTNPVAAIVQQFALYVVLGSALLAEMLIAPALIAYAHKLHRAGRPILSERHDDQERHEKIIESIDAKIDRILDRIGNACAESDKHESAMSEMIETALGLLRETAAEFENHKKRAHDEFFSRRSKGGLR